MGVRNEAVRLSLQDDGFTTTGAKCAAIIKLLDGALNDLDGSSVRANRSTSSLGSGSGGLAQTAVQARRASTDLNQFTGRLNLILSAATVLGPALVPIGAVGIPALTGLTAGLAAAAGGVGVAVMAFSGFGDALEALNAFQLDPTQENLESVKETLGSMGPAAQDLVFRLDELGPSLKRLQQAAQEEMFPGVNEGLDDLVSMLPEVQGIATAIAGTLGDLAAATGDSLANDSDWQEFFAYLRTDAAPILDEFARGVGNFVAGIGNILVAFRPLSDDFSDGLLGMSRDFREWAAGLSETDGFQEFVDYIRENGDQVAAFFAASADAIVALTAATAEWGSFGLSVLTDAARVFATIMDSPIGPVIFEAAAAMLVLNRANAGFAAIAPQVSGGFATMRTSVSTLRADLATIGTTWATAGATSQREATRLAAAQDRVKASLSQLGGVARSAAGVGGMMLMVDGMQRAGTAMGALETAAGAAATGFAVGGPWGAAIGGGIGLLMSFSQANAAAADEVAALTATFDQQTGAITNNTRAKINAQAQESGLLDAAEALGLQASLVTDAIMGNVGAMEQLNAATSGYDSDYTVTSVENLRKAFSEQEVQAILSARAATTLRDEIPGLSSTFAAASRDAQQFARGMGQTGDAAGQYVTVTGELSGAQKYAALMMQQTTQQADKQAKALRDSRQEARQSGREWTALGSSLDDSKVSLREWINQLADQARALEQFTANAQRAAERGLRDGLIRELDAAGPAGAMRMRQLANGTDAEIARANRAWKRGQDAIRDYVNMAVPEKNIDVNPNPALNAIGQVRSDLANLSDRHLTVWVTERHRDAARSSIGPGVIGTSPKQEADGGTVPKTGLGYADRHLYLLADGEEVISNRYGQADRNRPLLKAINANRLADGGTAGDEDDDEEAKKKRRRRPAVFIADNQWTDLSEADSLRDVIRELRGGLRGMNFDLRGLSRQVRRSESAVERERTKRDALQAKFDEVAGTVSGGLRSDIFAAPDNVWVADGTTPEDRLRADIAAAQQREGMIGQLSSKGLKGAALAELLATNDAGLIAQYAGKSAAELQVYSSLFNQRETALSSVGRAAGDAAFGRALEKQTEVFDRANSKLDRLNDQVRDLRQEIKSQTKTLEKASEENADRVGDKINGAGGRAKRSQRRDRGSRVESGFGGSFG